MIGIILALATTILFVSCIKDPSLVVVPTIPAVETAEVTNIAETSATVGGNVSFEGYASVQERGLCWSLSSNPTVSDNKISNGVGLGSFTGTINGLIAGTTYHIRAYAKNSVGVSYGLDVSFVTAAIMHKVTIISVANGTATAPNYVANGGKLDVTAVPAIGFMTDYIDVNGVKFNLNGINSYSIVNNQKPPVIVVTFKQDVLWTLLEKPWIETLLQERLVGATTWDDKYEFHVEKYDFHNNNQVSFYLDGNQGADRRYELKGDSLIVGADINGKYGNRYKIVAISRETLVLKEVIEYVTPEGKLDPSKNKESQKTFKH